MIYADDILIMAMTSEETTRLKERFMERFECKDHGEIKPFLGINVAIYACDHIHLDQTRLSLLDCMLCFHLFVLPHCLMIPLTD